MTAYDPFLDGVETGAAFSHSLGCDAVAAERDHLKEQVVALQAEVRRVRAWGERYRDMHDTAAKALSVERANVIRVAMVKCWTNEDGKRFMFVEDVAEALGITRADVENGARS